MTRRLVAAALAALLVACGVENDTVPRDVSPADVPDDGVDVPTSVQAASSRVRIFLLAAPVASGADTLLPVPRLVEPTPAALFEALVAGPLPDDPEALRSAIPEGVTLLGSPSVRSGIITLDVSTEIDQASGRALIEAMAQIVFTMTTIPSVDEVRLTVEGEVREWPTGDGGLTDAPLSQFDYPDLNPTSQPDYPAMPAPVTTGSS